MSEMQFPPEEWQLRRFLTDYERAGSSSKQNSCLRSEPRARYGQLGFLDHRRQVPVATESPSSKGNALGSGLLRQIMGMIPAMRQKRSSLPDMFDPSLGEIGMPRTPVPADFLHLFMDKEVTG
jgi:hypothetical protein